jgi:alkyldihydroxyacetonephosphate synthase
VEGGAVRRWNGWGNAAVPAELPPHAAELLGELVGPGCPAADATLSDVADALACSRLPSHRLVTTEPRERVLHSRGQSFPDWVALRSGRLGTATDGVAHPTSDQDVEELLRFAAGVQAHVIPYGGGTSVAGHVNPLPDRPSLTVSLSHMSQLRGLDVDSRLATFEAGVVGPDLEAQLRAHGFCLGHYPQSFEYSTLGGWVATRSSGQQSLGYGRIEDLFAAGRVVAPAGSLDIPALPASAAGPDLKQVVLGSEGRYGIITRATVRISPLPAREVFVPVFMPSWDDGLAAVRAIAQTDAPLSMLRLSNPVETMTTLRLVPRSASISMLERYLMVRGLGPERCLLLIGVTGTGRLAASARGLAISLARERGGVRGPGAIGRHWQRNRFRAPYLRNALWTAGYGVDTLETACPWSRLASLHDAIEASLRNALARWSERVHVFSHVSHVYTDGASLYTTYVFRLAPDPDENVARWRAMKHAASLAIVAHGGTISHQHGVGLDHREYLAAEKGELGIATLRQLAHHFDPPGVMNPGKLVDEV